MLNRGIQDAESTAGRRRAIWWIVPIVITAAFGYTLVWTASYPGAPFAGVALVGLLGVAVILVWSICIRAATKIIHAVVGIVSVALVVSSVATTATGAPLRIRFAASAAAFDTVVKEADAHLAAGDGHPGSFPVPCPTRIGQFRISECVVIGATNPARSGEVAEHVYLFVQSRDAVTDTSGIEYLPDGVNALRGWDRPRHLSGPWYGQTCGC